MAKVLDPIPAGAAATTGLEVNYLNLYSKISSNRVRELTTGQGKSQYVYFHSGSETTYRKIAEKPSSFTSIPTINLSDIDSPSPDDRKRIAKEVYDACHNCGFFYVQNHGISERVVTETFELLQRFFALDHETKMDAHVQKNPAIRGYEPMLETRLDPRTKGGRFPGPNPGINFADRPVDTKEAFTMGDCVMEPEQDYVGKTGRQPPSHITKSQNIWPKDAPWWREGLYSYYNHILPLAMNLVKIFALAFDLEETALDKYFNFPITGMRALYYPPTPVDDESPSIGLGAHADFSCRLLSGQGDKEGLGETYLRERLTLSTLCRAHARPPRQHSGPRSPQPGWRLGRRTT